MENKTKIHGSFLIGVIQTFYSLNAITKEKVENQLENLSPNDWYPLKNLMYIFKLLKENEYVSPQLLFQAGATFIQTWHDNIGKELNLGSIGHLKLQDNSDGIKHVFKDYDSKKLFTNLIELDIENGHAILESSGMFPIDFLKGNFYHGMNMWGDLLWLDIQVQVIKEEEEYNYAKFIFDFKLQDTSQSNELIDSFIDNLSLNKKESISAEMALQLAWKLKGMKKLYNIEQAINKKANHMLGIALQNQVKISEDLEKANKTIEEQSNKDFLTGLYNKRYFDKALSDLWFRSMRRKELLTILMIDIDYFKLYNDAYGHLEGDEALKSVAKCIEEIFQRHDDIVARFGGEEFVVAMVESNKEQIKEHVKHLIKKIHDKRIEHKSSEIENYVTISVGVSSLIPTNDNSIDSLLTLADNALYKAKGNGRNRGEFI